MKQSHPNGRFGGLFPLLISLTCAFCAPGFPSDSAAGPDSVYQDSTLPVMALLDPVDLATGETQQSYGNLLRKGLERTARFRVLPRDAMEQKLREFAWNGARPCHEFQCGFDAGNVLLSEYVLFGTLTAAEGVFAYTLNVLHVPSGQVVASEVGDVPGALQDGGDEPLKARLDTFLSGLDPARFDKNKSVSRGLMAVVDLNPESLESRVLAERVGTHVYASRRFDLMSQLELKELLSAIGIPLSSIATTDSGMIGLGSRLNVAYLVHSRLNRDNRGMRLDLALFDVTAHRRIRDWTSKSAGDFQDVLHLENRFFTTLTDMKTDAADSDRVVARKGFRPPWLRAVLTVSGLSATAGLAALAYASNRDANGAYDRAEASLSEDAGRIWRQRTEQRDGKTLLYGSFAVLFLGASIVLWTF